MKRMLFLITALVLLGCTKKADSKFTVSKWESLSMAEKARVYCETKYKASKSKEGNSEFLHLQTIISICPPMTKNEQRKFKEEKINTLRENPKWGDYKKLLVAYNQNNSNSVKLFDKPQKKHENTLQNELKKEQDKNFFKKLTSIEPVQKFSHEETQQQALIKNTENKANEIIQKKQPITKAGETEKKKQIMFPEIEENKPEAKLFDDGDFPSGKFITKEFLSDLPYGEQKGNNYLIQTLEVKEMFNDGYICQIKSDGFISSIFNKDKNSFFVKFPFATSYLKKGSVLVFSQKSPLKILSKIKISDPSGDSFDKYYCEYDGKTVHAVK